MAKFKLSGAVVGGGEWESGNRLSIEGGEARLERSGAMGASRLSAMPLGSITEVVTGTPADLVGGAALDEETQQAVARVSSEEPDGRVMVVRFDDAERGHPTWVFGGPAERVERARAIVEESRGATSAAFVQAVDEQVQEGVLDPADIEQPPPVPGAHRAIILVTSVVLIAVVAAAAFLATRYWPSELPSFGGDEETAEPAPPNGGGGGSNGDDGIPDDDGPEPRIEVTNPYAPGAMVALERQFARRLGVANPRYTEMIISDQYAEFTVLNAEGEPDAYEWRPRGWSGPVAAPISPVSAPAEEVFRRKDVRLAAIPSLARRALRVDLGGNTTLSTTIIDRALPFSRDMWIRVNITGDRRSGQLRANGRGQVTEILKS